jgi:hypothetical protein
MIKSRANNGICDPHHPRDVVLVMDMRYIAIDAMHMHVRPVVAAYCAVRVPRSGCWLYVVPEALSLTQQPAGEMVRPLFCISEVG